MGRSTQEIESDLAVAKQAERDATQARKAAADLAADLRRRATAGEAVDARALVDADAAVELSGLGIDARKAAVAKLTEELRASDADAFADSIAETIPPLFAATDEALAAVEDAMGRLVAAYDAEVQGVRLSVGVVGRKGFDRVSKRIVLRGGTYSVDGVTLQTSALQVPLAKLIEQTTSQLVRVGLR